MVSSCLKDVGKAIFTGAVLPPIKQNLGYWWFFDDNIQALTRAIRDLKREKCDMDRKIEAARLRGESATPEVGDWLTQVTQKLEEANTTLQSGNQLERGELYQRYLVAKHANKSVEDIAKLQEEGKSITISDPPPPPSMSPIPHEPTMEFESRSLIEKDIIESLKDDQVHMIAICGPGGVGKTTMVQKIVERVRKQLFDELVLVVVSQQIDMLKIQREIAEILGLNLGETTLAGRAHKIRTRLQDSTTKLVIFDDVWKSFNPNDIGVPFGCKIILTSRLKDVCEKMGAKVFQIEVLDDVESWRLFMKNSGIREDDSVLLPIAKDVAAECGGLPIALVPIAMALKNKNIHTWEDSLSQLKSANPVNFPKVLEDVYKPLKLSYDFLETESEKSLFLLCCLFPEDYEIPIELLTLYSFGLGILEGISNINGGRNRTHNLVEGLKSRFLLIHGHKLLIDGRKRDYVKMHDVVRDVAIFIGSKEKHGFLKYLQVSPVDRPSLYSSCDCRWMSIDISNENVELPVVPAFQNLCLLMIRKPYFFERNDDDTDFIGGMKELKVLTFLGICIESFPPLQESLKKLTMLYLSDSNVKNVSNVGELTSLEILQIRNCENIEELPVNFRRLNRLRLLELWGCGNLKRVAEGVISSLVRLEELKIVDSFDQWGATANGSEERNASLSELESLCKLTWLEIEISDRNLVPQQICLSQHLVRYGVHFTKYNWTYHHYRRSMIDRERKMILDLPIDIRIGNWIHRLVNNTQSLILYGDGSNCFNLAEIESLKELIFTNCSTVKKIDCKFHLLEYLQLYDLSKLESIVDGITQNVSMPRLQEIFISNCPNLSLFSQNVSMPSLLEISKIGKCPNLQKIIIDDCPNLRALFSLVTTKSLVQLQHLQIVDCDEIEIETNLEDGSLEIEDCDEIEIVDCDEIEQVSWNEIETNLEDESLEIVYCDEIEQVSWNEMETNLEDESLEFPQLTQLQIIRCPKLTKIGKCPNLQCLRLNSFNGLRHLLSSFRHREWISQLLELSIVDCGDIEQVFRDEIEDKGNRHIIFPKLQKLELGDLPCLTTLYRGVETINFPKLTEMKIKNLPRMMNLVPMDSEPSHDDHCLHSFCNEKDSITKIWCHHVPINFFQNLKILGIFGVNGIMNLMSSSIALNLVNLEHLDIKSCLAMIEVVEDDPEISVTSLFPKLNYIYLRYLPKLKSFWQWKHALEFPSLKYVHISYCTGMETFTLGSLTTPNLFELRMNDGPSEKKDLNGSIREHFINEDMTHLLHDTLSPFKAAVAKKYNWLAASEMTPTPSSALRPSTPSPMSKYIVVFLCMLCDEYGGD